MNCHRMMGATICRDPLCQHHRMLGSIEVASRDQAQGIEDVMNLPPVRTSLGIVEQAPDEQR
jgi:hypothetical protein